VKARLKKHYGMTQHRDAYHIPLTQGDCWVFDYGVLVAWGINEATLQSVYGSLASLIEEPCEIVPIEQYEWSVDAQSALQISHDHLTLPDDSTMVRLAISHAFAQSAKLITLEERAQQVIQQNSYIARELARTGKVSLSRRDLSKLRGVLFQTNSDISLHYGLLDTPEFFWDYPELEEGYLKLAKYLELQPRIDILTRKLDTIQGLLDMLADEQNHKHSAFLEWIIIVLIAVDIVIYML
jgi:uncharacterized Rmd1/YagE family protein